MRSSVGLCTWIRTVATGLVPVDCVVAVEIDSSILWRTVLSISWVHVLTASCDLARGEENVLNISEAINIDDWDNVVLVLEKQV